MEYTKEFLKRVSNAHRKRGFGFRIQNRKGKQYITISSRGVKHRPVTYWNSHAKLSEHIQDIFPGAHVTSGSWGGSYFDVTYRVNP